MHPLLAVLGGPASVALARGVCDALSVQPVAYRCQRFPDREAQVELGETVRGRDVFLIQATSPPADVHLVELLLLADACRRDGAARLTGVVPYFGYARQDRRIGRQSLGGAVAASLIGTARLDSLVLVNVHTPAIEGFFTCPIEHLSAVPLLARALAPAANGVVVAPDLGAVKLAREYARLLKLPTAIVHKTRRDAESVEATDVVGEVRDRAAIVVDDILSTAGTLEAAVQALRAAGSIEPVTVAVTHALLVGRAREVLPSLGLAALVAGDTVAIDPPAGVPFRTISIAPLLADAIRRLHAAERVS
jgi:ribose-phosphate pyrophosphokinase